MRRSPFPAVYGLLAAQIVAVLLFAAFWDSLDFRIYRLGGDAVTQGADLYLKRHAGLWYTNTPFAATLFIPLAELPLAVARVLWQSASVGAFAWACAMALKLAGHRPSRRVIATTVALGLLLQPMWQSIFLGQVNPFLLALVLTDIRRVSLNRAAGIGIGIAAAIKLTPGIFIVMLLVTRRFKDAFIAGGTFALCTSIAYLIAPEASRVYWKGTFCDTSRVGVTYISNQSPFAAAARILGSANDVPGWFFAVPLALGLAGLAVAALWARRNDWLAAAAVTGTTGLLVSPISWAHHWLWVVPALLVLVRNGARVPAAGAYLLFALSPLWWTPHGGHRLQFGFHGPLTLVANCYLVAGLAFLAYMAAALRGPAGRGQVVRRERDRDRPPRITATSPSIRAKIPPPRPLPVPRPPSAVTTTSPPATMATTPAPRAATAPFRPKRAARARARPPATTPASPDSAATMAPIRPGPME
ncbi:hypothetical protein ACRB68_13210 [Actinomadura sp. RB68]|uniref:DUF2029 domain-containing protein n=1 Tax=Actinomadura macrotermitis TaxID=2585200 RepID=A0A7K0BQ09_9ACTN|nr:hypothetical protein [Actinomadura macrotermitis]